METVYFFLLIFCGIYGALKLAGLFYSGMIDKINGMARMRRTQKRKGMTDG